MTELPDKKSELLKLALKDLRACMKDKRYRIHMEIFHNYNPLYKICYVCLAGAVMAKTLKCKITEDIWPEGFDEDVHDKLVWLDKIRREIRVSYGVRFDDDQVLFLDKLKEEIKVLAAQGD